MLKTALLDIEEITAEEDFYSLWGKWSGLWERSCSSTPFQSPEWLTAWWRHLGEGSLFTLGIRFGAHLVGLAPFFIKRLNNGNIREVRFVGTGISDYLDIIVDPDFMVMGAESVFRYLAANRFRWERCVLDELRPSSPMVFVGAPAHLRPRMETASICPVLKLPETVENFHAGLTPSYRIRMKRAWRAMERSGNMEIELADERTLPEFMDNLFALHAARWALEGKPGVLSDEKIRSFHMEAAKGLLKRGVLRLYRLKYNGEPASVIYGFVKGGRFYSYLGGFDPKIERMSPGRVLMGHVIEDCIGQGLKEFDFLRGSEKYKYVWGAKDTVSSRLVLHSV